MQTGKVSSVASILCTLALSLVLMPQQSASSAAQQQEMPMQSSPGEPVPAFHTHPPQGDLPATMDPEQFTDPVVRNAYALAARNKKLLYQQPCYCHCDRSQGHGSLHDCFVSKHGAGCEICVKENFYTHEQARKGKTAAQIREGIERGEWQSVDVSKYQKPLPATR